MDLAKRTVRRGETRIKLTAKEFTLLEFLIRNSEQVLPRGVITEEVWDMNYEPTSNVVDVYISNLRRKVDKPFPDKLIHTVIGTGYRFGHAGA